MNKKMYPIIQPLVKTSIAALAALSIVGCATVTTAPNTTPEATVQIKQVSAAYYGSATSGQGTLNFNGQRRKFTISSVGVGGAGGMKITATGKVYGLKDLSQFPGKYRGVSRGLTLMEGKMYAKLTNANGVVIYLSGDTEGLASSMGLHTYQITLLD